MKRTLLLLGFFLLSCSGVRNKTTYRAEVEFTNTVVTRGLPPVTRFLSTQCQCSGDVWTASAQGVETASCAAAADWVFTVAARWRWHHAMMRYNGSLSDVDPGPAPTIPEVSCTLPEVR